MARQRIPMRMPANARLTLTSLFGRADARSRAFLPAYRFVSSGISRFRHFAARANLGSGRFQLRGHGSGRAHLVEGDGDCSQRSGTRSGGFPTSNFDFDQTRWRWQNETGTSTNIGT
jgi:hypothetical protein